MQVDPKLLLQVLQFLLNVYNSTLGRSSNKSPTETPQDVQTRSETPDPGKLGELIKEVEEKPGENVERAIDRRFSPEEAKRVKDDLAAFLLFASPPRLADYDFYGIIQSYAKGIQAVALRTELFRLRGQKAAQGFRILPMPDAGTALLPKDVARDAVHAYGEAFSASPKEWKAFLTDEDRDVPLVIFIEAKFSFGYLTGGTYNEGGADLYRLKDGQERNWLEFVGQRKAAGFQDFEYRLTASETASITAALREDIASYLRELEKEQVLVGKLHQELNSFLKKIRIDKPEER